MVEKIYLRIYPTAPPDVHYRDHVTDFRFDTHTTNQMNDHLQNKLMVHVPINVKIVKKNLIPISLIIMKRNLNSVIIIQDNINTNCSKLFYY